jgi:ABC-type multidrug transport system fused ATPase/permease subunit
MNKLLKIAFSNLKHRFLIILTLIFMVLLTFASQLEMVAVGVLTKKGPDFFELFAPDDKGTLIPKEQISREELLERWSQLDASNKGYVTVADTEQFLKTVQSTRFFDKVFNKLNAIFSISDNFKNLALFLVFVALFKATTLFVHRYSTKLLAIRISRDLRQSYFEHIQALPMEFYQKYNMGSLSSRVVGDAVQIAEAVDACLTNYLQTPFAMLTTMSFCFMISWKLSLIIFVGFPLLILPIAFLAKRVKRVSRQIQQNQERFASVLLDFLAGIQTVKVFAMEDFSLKKYREQNDRMAALEQKNARYDLSTRPVVHTIAMFFVALALIYGLYVLNLSVSEVFVFCGFLYLFYEPIKKFAEENTRIQRGVVAADRLFEVMDMKPQIQDNEEALEVEHFETQIEFDNVWFKYNDEWILKGLSFTVNKGETVAIVGPTGAGKSTIVQLLPRLFDVQKGEIRINGTPIKAFTQKSLRDLIGFVPQRPFLFLDTVAQNISYGRKFTPEQIQEAARKAHAEEFITKLAQGYQTELSETGKNLSGGQQQRLAIARALVKNAPILVMDEATSSLDTVSEHHIKTAIQQLRGQVTQIIIAHRLSTIEDADKIIYLEKGEKIAEGTRDELLKSCDGFRQMWEMMHHASQPKTVQHVS